MVNFASAFVPFYNVQLIAIINYEILRQTQFVFINSCRSFIQLWLHVYHALQNMQTGTGDKGQFHILKSSQIVSRFPQNKHSFMENYRISIDNLSFTLIEALIAAKDRMLPRHFISISANVFQTYLAILYLSISLVIWQLIQLVSLVIPAAREIGTVIPSMKGLFNSIHCCSFVITQHPFWCDFLKYKHAVRK